MKMKRTAFVTLCIMLTAIIGTSDLLSLSQTAFAQASSYHLTLLGWGSSTITSGGGYQMAATIAQPEADEISGGGYTINGGVGGGNRIIIAVTPTAVPTPVPTGTPLPDATNSVYLPLVTR